MADHVQVLANLNFFGRHGAELSIVQTHVHFVVYVRPLGCVIELSAVLSKSVHEVAGLLEIIKGEFFLDGAVFSCGPARSQSAHRLGG